MENDYQKKYMEAKLNARKKISSMTRKNNKDIQEIYHRIMGTMSNGNLEEDED